jgi:DNA-binding MarR family transcriptional regulator
MDHHYIDQTLELLPRIVKLVFASLAQAAAEEGYSIPQMKAMHFLSRHEPCTVGALADLVGVSPATVSEQIDRMVEADLAERTINPGDRRQVLVSLTPRAREWMRGINQQRRAQVEAAFEHLEPGERQTFVKGLAALHDVLAASPERCASVEAMQRVFDV